MPHRITRLLATVGAATACSFAGITAIASLALAQEVIPIADALETLKVSEYFVVEGTIVDSIEPDIYWIEDDSGKMPIKIKEYMTREHGEINPNDRLRIWGRFDEKKLDKDVRGMMVSRLYRLPQELGGSGADNPHAKSDAGVTPANRRALPAAPSGDSPDIMKPAATEEFEQRVRDEMRAYRKAEQDALDAGQAYARAAREAGSDGQVDAAVIERLQAAEARVVEIRSGIPDLVNEARDAGVDEGIIQMIEMQTGLRK
jgi:uncharacterized protein YdeI (BOF family)